VLRNRFFAPNTIFSLIWSIILIAFLSYNERYYQFSVKSSLLLLLGSLCFLIGSGLFTNHLPSRLPEVENRPTVLRAKIFIFLSLLTIIVLVYKAALNVQFLMLGMNFNDLQIMSLSQPEESRDFLISVITSLVAGPFAYVVIPVLGLELSQPKSRWWVILLTLLIIILFILQSGRRSLLLYIIPSILYLVINKPKSAFSFKEKLKLFLNYSPLFGIILYLISWLSFQRDTSFSETGYIYLGGGIAGFSQRIEQVDTYYLGAGTLHGILVPVMIGIKYLTHSYPIWWIKLDALVEAANEINIGPSEYMNAFTSMFYAPYIDFGATGVLVISLFVGIIYGKAYKRVFSNPNSLNRSIYALLIVGLFGSMYTLYFTQSPYVLSFIYVYFLFKQK
jgi:oligosaccharide repeat unit polymerase